MWHSDVFKACGCGRMMDDSCGDCLDRTPNRDQVLVTRNTTDIDIEIPEEKEEETQYKEVETSKYLEAYADRTSRIYCRLLMSTVGSPLCSAESPRQLLEAVLGAILGYWRLVNMGLLHRDISDGNVLMLREEYGYNKREWKVPRSTTDELDAGLTESERPLQDVPGCLARGPAGMLNDFDLFTTHGELGAAFFGDSPSEDIEDKADEPGSKRQKLNSRAAASTHSPKSGKGKEREESKPGEQTLGRAVGAEQRARQPADFRTGTPTYMSARVLKIKLGRRYEHHFMDDLESFFWLILLCVIEHVDSPDDKPTEDALELLDDLESPRLKAIVKAKFTLLQHCAGTGRMMRETLESLENSWAEDPAIVSVVLKLGAYFNGIYDRSLENYVPNEVFPMIVEVIMGALDSK
ncbi:hypothetical protein FRC08_001525 [Ceratobasidium sp. 394]|nr:hypothetical protein FRC08_001525 [Ceratobasidium sp. 394]